MFWGSCNLAVCQSVWHCGIGNDRMPGIAAFGMPRGPALLYNGDFECQGSGIGNVRMLGIAALGMSECLALRHRINLLRYHKR